jgi:hypothetical protein
VTSALEVVAAVVALVPVLDVEIDVVTDLKCGNPARAPATPKVRNAAPTRSTTNANRRLRRTYRPFAALNSDDCRMATETHLGARVKFAAISVRPWVRELAVAIRSR